MKKFFIYLSAAALFFTSCGKDSQAVIEGNLPGLTDTRLLIQRLDLSRMTVVDSVFINSKGHFSKRLTLSQASPEFYYIGQEDGTSLASLLLSAGDKLSLSMDPGSKKITVTGSEDTRLLHEAEAVMTVAKHRYDSLITLYIAAGEGSERARELNYELGRLYVKQKQSAIRFVMEHAKSMASVHVLYSGITEELPLFAELVDMVYFRQLHDSLQPLYPKSRYVAALKNEYEARQRNLGFTEKLSMVKELAYPDLVLPNVKAEPVQLSSLQGKVILLSFWVSQDVQQRLMNQELMEVYKQYASKGLEIYQVALDTDKTAWAKAISDQALPWISVCDGRGANSVAVTSYVVTQVPSNFLIDKEGNIVGRDLDLATLKTQLSKLCK
jgi:Peroxiredoxin